MEGLDLEKVERFLHRNYPSLYRSRSKSLDRQEDLFWLKKLRLAKDKEERKKAIKELNRLGIKVYKVSDTDLARTILDLYLNKNKKLTLISKELTLPLSKIKYTIYNRHLRNRYKKFSDQEVKTIVELYYKNYPIKEIAQHLNRSFISVNSKIKELISKNRLKRRKKRWKEEEVSEVVRLFNSYKAKSLAKLFKTTDLAIYSILKRYRRRYESRNKNN